MLDGRICDNCEKRDCDGKLFITVNPIALIRSGPQQVRTVCMGKRDILYDNDSRPYFVLTFGHGDRERVPLDRM